MLLKTSKSDKHYHLVFIREDGTGYTSMDRGHYHAVVVTDDFKNFQIDRAEIQEDFFNTDPEESDKDQNVAENQNLVRFKLCKIITTNGHTHEIQGINLQNRNSEDKTLTGADKVRRVYDLTKECMDADQESKKAAEESCKVKKGDQWGKDKETELESSGRAHNTHNYVKKYLKFLSGLFRQNKMDIQVLPEEESDSFAVDILNPVLRRIQHNTKFHKHEVQAFDDVTKTGRGALMVDIDTSVNPFGDVCVKYFRWQDFSPMSHIEVDGSDCEVLAVHPFYSLNEIKALYPDKADNLETDYARYERLERHKKDYVQHRSHQYEQSEQVYPFMGPEFGKYRWVDRIRRRIMMLHIFEKIKTNRKVAANAVEDEYVEVTRMNKTDLTKFKNFYGFSLVNSCDTKIKITVVAGNTILEERYSLFDDFNLCWCYADKEDDFWSGITHDIKDSQREVNKWSSKFSDLLNQIDAWHLGVSLEAFATPEDYDDYMENSNKPGFVPKFAPGFHQHVKEFSNSNFSQLRDTLTGVEQAIKQMGEIVNITSSNLAATDVVDGVSMANRNRASLIGNEYIFDNFSAMKMKVGRLILQVVQKTWSPERILRLVESQNTREAITIGGDALYPELGPQELIQFGVNTRVITQQDAQRMVEGMQNQKLSPADQKILTSLQEQYRDFVRERYLLIIENKDLSKYDVSVVENTHSPTTMLSNFMVLADLARNRPDVPITSIIKSYPFMSVADKTEIINGIISAQNAKLQEQKMKYDMELQKTMIANQGNQQGQGQIEQQVQPGA